MVETTTIIRTATCDKEGCGATVDLGTKVAVRITLNTNKTENQRLCFCNADHCNTWWKTSTQQNLVPDDPVE